MRGVENRDVTVRRSRIEIKYLTRSKGVHAYGSVVEEEANVTRFYRHTVEQMRAHTHDQHNANPESEAEQRIHV